MTTAAQAPPPPVSQAVEIVAAVLATHTSTPDSDTATAIVDALTTAGLITAPQPRPTPTPGVPLSGTQARRMATARVEARTIRSGCARPDKAAYNPDDPHEARLIERRRRPGMELYQCRCQWWHLGNPTPPDPPTLPDDPIVWARDHRRVALYSGQGDVVACGIVETFTDAPTLQVTLDSGRRQTWVASLARLLPPPDC